MLNRSDLVKFFPLAVIVYFLWGLLSWILYLFKLGQLGGLSTASGFFPVVLLWGFFFLFLTYFVLLVISFTRNIRFFWLLSLSGLFVLILFRFAQIVVSVQNYPTGQFFQQMGAEGLLSLFVPLILFIIGLWELKN